MTDRLSFSEDVNTVHAMKSTGEMRSAPSSKQNDARRSETILVVDDEDDVRRTVSLLLEDEGYAVLEAATADEAERIIAQNTIALALVDLRLGDQDGLDLVRTLAVTPGVAIIILSGKGSAIDKVVGIEVGADDYITKPFDNRELLARVKRRIARLRALRELTRDQDENAPITVAPWTIDPAAHSVEKADGTHADLADGEFRTLLFLARNRGTVLSRDAIHRAVVGPGERDPLDRRIDVHVSNLRKKLGLPAGEGGIRTVHRVGYVID